MALRTPEEIKKNQMEILGEEFGTLYNKLYNEVISIET